MDATTVVKVAERGRFKVYIYEEERGRHHLPHCHVQWSDGAASIRLPDMSHLAGDELPSGARVLLSEHERDLIETWNMLNPERPIV